MKTQVLPTYTNLATTCLFESYKDNIEYWRDPNTDKLWAVDFNDNEDSPKIYEIVH